MLGYYKEPEQTAEVLVDGWFHTGDLVRQDPDGYYYITGRKKNLIILASGENVSPEELEKLVLACPEALECQVMEKEDRICAQVYAPDDPDKVRAHITGINRTPASLQADHQGGVPRRTLPPQRHRQTDPGPINSPPPPPCSFGDGGLFLSAAVCQEGKKRQNASGAGKQKAPAGADASQGSRHDFGDHEKITTGRHVRTVVIHIQW